MSKPLKPLSQLLSGLAWASCWPSALEAARENRPGLLLLGALGMLLPDTLDRWFARLLFKPDIHIVPPPEAPDPQMIAAALADAIALAHRTHRPVKIECYPVPIGPARWVAYSLLFDASRREVSVTVDLPSTPGATAFTLCGFTTDHPHRLSILDSPLSLHVNPPVNGCVSLDIDPTERRWSHSLLLACGLGIIATALQGFPAGAIACGAFALHLFIDQWGFAGCAVLWPFKHRRLPALQWIKPHQHLRTDFVLFWLALLLLTGNIIHSPPSAIEGPSRFQLLILGGAIPLAILSRFRLNDARKKPDIRRQESK